MTNESPFRKNRAFYIGVVLTVLEGILSGCSYLSVYIVLTALACICQVKVDTKKRS